MASVGGVRYDVKVQEPVLVQPAFSQYASEERPYAYFLSNLDLATVPVVVESVFVFNPKSAAANVCGDAPHPAKLLKEALRNVLVQFYPLAGRLRLSPHDNRLFIECNAQGVAFVEADANIEICDLGAFSQPDAATLGPLVFPLPATDDRPLLSAQVTRFKCGGFVLGFVFQHCVFDGVAAVEFLNAWAETARGVPISTPPFLDRAFLCSRSPLQVKYSHIEYLQIEDLSSSLNVSDNSIERSFCFTPVSLEALKKKALEDGMLSKCSTFEALSGLIWRARTRALWSENPKQKVKLLIAVDGRSSIEPGLPEGYMGNGLLSTCAIASAGELAENPLSHAVKHVQNAIGRVTDEYMRSQIDYIERDKLGLPPLGATLGITTWSKLSFNILDFGWGKPKYVGPVSLMVMEACIFLSYGEDGKGINVVLGLPPNAMHKFEELLRPHLNPFSLSPARL